MKLRYTELARYAIGYERSKADRVQYKLCEMLEKGECLLAEEHAIAQKLWEGTRLWARLMVCRQQGKKTRLLREKWYSYIAGLEDERWKNVMI